MSAQDYLNRAQAVSDAILRGTKPSSVPHAWQMKKNVTDAQRQLSQVKHQITQEMRVLNEETTPKVATVGTGGAGRAGGDSQSQLADYRKAKDHINDMLLQTWEIKFDLEEYISEQGKTGQLGKGQ
jgi:hypothetical protein